MDIISVYKRSLRNSMSTPIFSSPKFLFLGDSAITIQFGAEASLKVNERVRQFVGRLEKKINTGNLPFIKEYVPAITSVTIYFDPFINRVALNVSLRTLLEDSRVRSKNSRSWILPICFEPSFSLDMEIICDQLNISADEVIKQICNTKLYVFMIGFMPGFPFMGQIPGSLSMPRHSSPRSQVPAQSVAIAGMMCGIYPWESPGGWNIIARMPVPLFNSRDDRRPTLLTAGDQVAWNLISADEYESIIVAQQNEINWDSYMAEAQ